MEGLQRSTVSFRRQGSSGLVWDDKLVTRELNKLNERDGGQTDDPAAADKTNNLKPINLGRRQSSNDDSDRGYRTGRVAPAVEPPSPRVSACGLCGGGFKKPAAAAGNKKVHRANKQQGKRAKR